MKLALPTREEIDMAELYVPFSWFEPMWSRTCSSLKRMRAGS